MDKPARLSRGFTFLLFLPLVTLPQWQASGQVRLPAHIVVIFDGLTLDDLYNSALPNVSGLPKRGFVGLMNTAVSDPRNNTAAILPLALGFLAPAEPTDEYAFMSET